MGKQFYKNKKVRVNISWLVHLFFYARIITAVVVDRIPSIMMTNARH